MSSSRRYQEDIRRIVGLQDTLRGLDEEVPRMRIEGSRGIFLIGAGETKSGASPGVGEDGETTDPIMPDENDDNLNEDGSGMGGAGTDPSETDIGSGDSGIGVIDPEDSGNYSPDDSTFGGGWASGGVSTFTDCASGKCIEIVDRGGYVPPEGWDSADVPPEVDPSLVESLGYIPGEVWCDNGGEFCATGYATAVGAAKAYAANGGREYCFQNPQCPTVLSCVSQQSNGNYLFLHNRSFPGDPCPSGVVGTQQAGVFSSRVSTVDPTTLPDYGDLSPETWPSDNCIQLSPNSAGQWAASSREPAEDMTAKYSEAKSILDLCAPNGDGVQILPGADGGSVRWNYTQGRFMATSPEGRRSFGGATELTMAVAGSVKDGGAIKAQGAPVPTT